MSVSEDGVYLLLGEVSKALEDPTLRKGAADLLTHWSVAAKMDFQEHTPDLLTVIAVPPMV